jgi:glutamate 5-kinase
VVKVGTRVLTHPDGRLALARIHQIIEVVAQVRRTRDVLLVSSGAVGLGQEALGLEAAPSELTLRQACAAVGQSRLMEIYQRGFERMGVITAQVLLTAGDFEDDERYVNLRATLMGLLRRRVVPIVNENDVVATDELSLDGTSGTAGFGDNDRLSALVASRLRCELLVLCTDVDGVYDRDPRVDENARRLSLVTSTEGLEFGRPGAGGRGGMASKVSAARLASEAGCDVVIVSGLDPEALSLALEGHEVGTWFPGAAP